MTIAVNSLWTKLKSVDLVKGDEPALDTINSPWYVKTLLAISGWLGAIFFLGFSFVFLISFVEEPFAFFFLSLPLFASAYFILAIPKNEFFEHIALAASLAGQALILWSLMELYASPFVWVAFGLLEVFLAYFMASFLHRAFSVVFASLAFEVSFTAFGMPYILSSLLIFPMVWFCLHEFNFTRQYKRMSGLMYGLVMATLLLNGNHLFGVELMNLISSSSYHNIVFPTWVGYGIFISAVVFTAQQLLSVYDIKLNSKISLVILSFSFILAFITLYAPGIMVGLIVILLGFAHSNRVIFGLGVLSLLLYSSTYYYMMEETLLFKSVILFSLAVFILISQLLLARFLLPLKEK